MYQTTSQRIAELVATELAAYRYEAVEPGATVGTPWSEEQVARSIQELRSCLVEPYIARVLTGTTAEEIARRSPSKDVWVVAESSHVVFFDPERQTYGIADRRPDEMAPVVIGVEGDLVYVFGAM